MSQLHLNLLTLEPGLFGSAILSGAIPFKTHTAPITTLTPIGGLFIDLTIPISLGLIVFNASLAASNAGKATANSA